MDLGVVCRLEVIAVCLLCKLLFFFREMRFYVLHHRTAFGATARTVELKVDAGFKSAHPL